MTAHPHVRPVPASPGPAPFFSLQGVSKRYGGTVALDGASLEIAAGTIHAILGENGAGKSTLIKIMSGVVAPDAGRLVLDGRPVRFDSPVAATASGIVCVFQELSLVPDLSVADNIVISDPPTRFGLIDRRAQRRIAEEALARAGASDIHPAARVADLPLSRRQLVEIAKALAKRPRVLILDEATSALAAADVERVFEVLTSLRDEGLALLFISHRMNEVDELADVCTVFRNGTDVASFPAGSKTDDELVELMIGRSYGQVFPPKPASLPTSDEVPVLEARGLSWAGRLHDVSFELRAREVVGLGGLDGQGQRELLLALFGVLRGVEGEVRVDGKPTRLGGPDAARETGVGMALIPEDRKTEGLMLPMTVRENLSFAALDSLARAGVIDRVAEAHRVDEVVDLLAIKSAGLDGPVGALSGGNQQKVVLGKWLMRGPRIILLNDPTRGIDIGTKQEIYRLLRRLADDGVAVLFYSTDHAELIGCCDRVLVFRDGAVVSRLVGDGITERALVSSALNVEGRPAAVGAEGKETNAWASPR